MLITFCSFPLSGIADTIEKSFHSQLNYLLKNSKTKQIVKDEFVPIVLFVDDQTKINSNDHTYLIQRIEKYFKLYNPNLLENFQMPNRTMGDINLKMLIAQSRSNSFPGCVILDSKGKRVALYSDLVSENLYSVLKQVQLQLSLLLLNLS